MVVTFKGVEVELLSCDGEVGEGAYCTAALFVETGEELDDTELEQLSEFYPETCYEFFYAGEIMRAEDAYDRLRDGSESEVN